MATDARLGLALGGGAVRGAAHLGVLKALDDAELKPHCLSGTSIGAFVAALYAFGKTPDDILEIIRELDFLDIARIRLHKLGLMSHDDMGKLIVKAIGEKNIEDSPIPLAIVATDLVSGQPVVFTEGPIVSAVLASTCIPGLFSPVSIGDKLLVDGGLVENVPVSQLPKLGADVVVGVNLNGSPDYGAPDDLIDVLFNATDIAIDTTTRIQMHSADVGINLSLSQYERTNPAHIQSLYDEGVNAAKDAIPAILQSLDDKEPNLLERMERGARSFVEEHWPY